jgi:type VI secretion system secreted protein VgrG
MSYGQDIESLTKGIGQQNRLLKLDTPLGPDVLLPQRVVGHERLGRSYEYTVDLISLRDHIALKELIAQPVTLWLRQTDCSYAPVHGYVHRIKKLGSDGQFTVCQLCFSPWMHFLKFRQDARIWQDKTVEDILADVFNVHPEGQGNFRFEINEAVPPRSYCTQYETDWHFAQRLMEEEGWYGYYEQKEDGSGHTLVITDTTRTLRSMERNGIHFHGGGTGDEVDKILQWGASRSLFSSKLTTRTFDYREPGNSKENNAPTLPEHGAIPSQLEVYEYTGAYTHAQNERGDRQARVRVEGWESQAKRFGGISGTRSLPAGRCFTLEDHPAHASDSAEDRLFMVINVDWFIENNLPMSKSVRDFPGSLKSQLDAFKLAMAVSQQADDDHAGHCFNRFEVQRRKVEFRSVLEHKKPLMHTQTAVVVGPAGEEIYTDDLNRVKVQFHWDRKNPANETASCWVRSSYPNAGQGYGAVNVPRIAQEVIITFLGGDADRPVITGRLYNGEQVPPWHTDGKLSGLKTKEYQGSGFNQLALDDNTGQNRVHLYSSNTNAQLNLGYLVTQEGNNRKGFYGSGFALNTDAYGAIVANLGLYISTFGRPGAQGTQLDAREAHQQLLAGTNLTKALSDTAVKAGAAPLAGQNALDKFAGATQDSYAGTDQEHANRFKEAVLVLASPAGIGLASPKGIHAHSGDNVTLSSGTDTNLAVGKSLAVSVANNISVYANNEGIKVCAGKGKIDLQAHDNDLDIIAAKVLRLMSATGRIEITAATEIVISAGGSFIKLDKSGISQGTAGKWIAQASTHSMPGPTTLSREMNKWAKTDFDEEFVALHQGSGKPVAHRAFELTREDGTILRGKTDAAGKTGIQKSQFMGNISLRFLGAIPR